MSYRGLPTLQGYLLLAQNRVRAELYVRQSDDTWNLSTYTERCDQVPLAAVDATLPLAEIYDKTDL